MSLIKRTIFIFTLSTSVFKVATTLAMNTRVDSLLGLLNRAKEDSNKVNLLFETGRQFDYFKSKERLEYTVSALSLAKKINNKPQIVRISSALVSNLFHRKMFDISMYYYLDRLTFLEKEGLNEEISRSYNLYGNLLSEQGKMSEALKYYHLARGYFEKLNESGGVANTCNNLSIIFTNNNMPDSALPYAQKAAELLKMQKGAAYANSILGLAEIFLKTGQLEKAALNANLSYLLYTHKDIPSKDIHGISNSLLVLNEIDLAEKKPQKALDDLIKSKPFIDSLNYPHLKMAYHLQCSETYKMLGKFSEALEHRILFQSFSDTMALNKLKGKMLEMEVKYDIGKKENELKQKDFELIAKSKQRNYLIVIIVVVLILFGISYNAYSLKRKANTLISEQKKLVDEKQTEILDSIRYAKRIQTALITNEKYIDKNLNRLMKD